MSRKATREEIERYWELMKRRDQGTIIERMVVNDLYITPVCNESGRDFDWKKWELEEVLPGLEKGFGISNPGLISECKRIIGLKSGGVVVEDLPTT